MPITDLPPASLIVGDRVTIRCGSTLRGHGTVTKIARVWVTIFDPSEQRDRRFRLDTQHEDDTTTGCAFWTEAQLAYEDLARNAREAIESHGFEAIRGRATPMRIIAVADFLAGLDEAAEAAALSDHMRKRFKSGEFDYLFPADATAGRHATSNPTATEGS